MRRVIFVNRYFFPDLAAGSQMLTDLAAYLAKDGMEVTVVASRQRYDDAHASLAAREVVAGVNVIRIATTRFGRASLLGRALDYLSFYFSAFWQLLCLLRNTDIVVAKTDPPLISVVAGVLARVMAARRVNWLQDIFPEVAAALGFALLKGSVGRLLRWARDWSLLSADANVVIGHNMAGRIRDLGVSADRITMIPNWADDQAIVPVSHEGNPLRREWGLEGKFVVAYSGNLGRAHEFGTILGAAHILRNQPDIIFLFIGDGAQLVSVKRFAAEHGLGNMLFRPYQPREQLGLSLGVGDLHLVSLMPELEGLIVPSKFYGIAAAGRAIAFIGDLDGEIGEMLQSYDCGRRFTVNDQVGLADFILALSKNPDERIRLGRNARFALEANFCQAKALEQWRMLLGKLA